MGVKSASEGMLNPTPTPFSNIRAGLAFGLLNSYARSGALKHARIRGQIMNSKDLFDKQVTAHNGKYERFGADYPHKWVVEDYKGEIVGSYDSQDEAMDAAVARFGDVLMMMTQTDDQPRIIIAPAFVDAQGNAYTPKNVPSVLSPFSAGVGPLPEIEYISVERDAVAVDADD